MSLLSRLLWIGGLLLCGGMILFSCERVAERGRFAQPYSTFGAGPDGSHGALLLAQELGFRAEPLSRELMQLPPQGTLVAIGGCDQPLSRPVSRPEREELARWIQAGGLLIVAGVEEYVPEDMGLTLSQKATCEAEKDSWLDPPKAEIELGDGGLGELDVELGALPEVDGTLPYSTLAYPDGPPLTYAKEVVLERARSVTADDESEATTLLSSDYGPLAITKPVGRGRVVLIGSGSLLQNRALSEGGGVVFARLLRAFARPAPVLFDEYHLGMGERRSLVRYLRDRGLSPLLLQVCLVILLALSATSQRLGPPVAEPRVEARSTQRYLEAMGALYARTGDGKGAYTVLAEHGLSRIARHYHLTHVPIAELSMALKTQGLFAVASYVDRVADHAARPLDKDETLLTRARAVERDVRAALVVGDA